MASQHGPCAVPSTAGLGVVGFTGSGISSGVFPGKLSGGGSLGSCIGGGTSGGRLPGGLSDGGSVGLPGMGGGISGGSIGAGIFSRLAISTSDLCFYQ
jgi:hypothetical protein